MNDFQVLAYKSFRRYQMKVFDAKQQYERELEELKTKEKEGITK